MIEQIISRRLQIPLHQVQGTVCLLREGATIPFISRYRKEATGSLDEVQVASVKEWLDRLTELETRKQTVLTTIEGQGRLTPELRRRIAECWDAVELEDIYLPYKPKRRTRATVARERGLEPLAEIILAQQSRNVVQQARRFVSAEVPTPEEALAGACDIVAERISEDERARNTLRRTFAREGIVHSKLVKGKETEGAKYADYFDAATPLRSISSHRFLAMRRGEEEGILKIAVDVDAEHCIESPRRLFVRPGSATREWMEAAVADSFKRLIRPSIETEQLAAAKEKADDEAIRVFAENLRQLLLSSPLGQKRVVAIDPGFRTGCKGVALDAQGNLLHNTTVYPHPPQGRAAEAAETLKSLAARYKAEAFAIGDGTAGRETEQLVRGLGLEGVEVFMVSEDGASVYSASAAAREEFPDYDVTVRGAVSIGRRLIDPLSELVKIDPKSIGVGYCSQRRPGEAQGAAPDGRRKLRQPRRRQYQHRLETHPDLHIGAGTRAGAEHRGLPCGERGVQKPQGAAQSAAAGSQGFRAGGRVPAGRRRRESAGQQRRAHGIVRRRRADGRRRGRDGRTPANRQTAAQRSLRPNDT